MYSYFWRCWHLFCLVETSDNRKFYLGMFWKHCIEENTNLNALIHALSGHVLFRSFSFGGLYLRVWPIAGMYNCWVFSVPKGSSQSTPVCPCNWYWARCPCSGFHNVGCGIWWLLGCSNLSIKGFVLNPVEVAGNVDTWKILFGNHIHRPIHNIMSIT